MTRIIYRFLTLAVLTGAAIIAHPAVASSNTLAPDPILLADYKSKLCGALDSMGDNCVSDKLVAAWFAAGASPRQAAKWEQDTEEFCTSSELSCFFSLTPEDAIKWFKNGFAPEDAQQILSEILPAGDQSSDDKTKALQIAIEWKKASFGISDMEMQMEKKVSLQDALHAREVEETTDYKKIPAIDYKTEVCNINQEGPCATDEVIAEWQAIGARPRQAEKWMDFGKNGLCEAVNLFCSVNDDEAQAIVIKWFKYGFTRNDAESITQSLVMRYGSGTSSLNVFVAIKEGPDIANKWKAAGFSVADTISWMSKGMSIQEAQQAKHRREGVSGLWATSIADHKTVVCAIPQVQSCMSVNAINEWKDGGVTPEQAAEWEPYVASGLSCGGDSDDPCVNHLSRSDASKWVRYGFSPGDAREITDALTTYSDDSQGGSAKTAPDFANDFKAAGFSVTATLYWISKGASVDEALSITKRRKAVGAAWAASIIPSGERAVWKRFNFSPTAASEWVKAGVSSAADAREYQSHGISASEAPALLQVLERSCPRDIPTTMPSNLNPYAAIGKCYFVSAGVIQIISNTQALAQAVDGVGIVDGGYMIINYVDKPTPGEGDIAYGVFKVKEVRQFQMPSGGMQTVAVATLVYEIQ